MDFVPLQGPVHIQPNPDNALGLFLDMSFPAQALARAGPTGQSGHLKLSPWGGVSPTRGLNVDEGKGTVEEEGPVTMAAPGRSVPLEGPCVCYSGMTLRDSSMLLGCFLHCTW